MSESIGFHGFFPSDIRREDVIQLTDEAARAVGFVPTYADASRWPTLEYARESGPPLAVVFSGQGAWQQLVVCALTISGPASYGIETIGSLFCVLAHSLGTALGRTFGEDWHGAVAERELDGDIAYLDWFQFLGPKVTSRWGIERLRSGPFHRLEAFGNGSCGLWLTEYPWSDDQREATKKACEFLGIALRPDFTRDAKGARSRINWP